MRGYRSRDRAPQGMRNRLLAEVAAAAAALGYSALLNHLLPDGVHVPANVTAASTATLVARAAGVSFADMGLDSSRAAAGARLGVSVAAPVVGALAAAAVVPATRRQFVDARVVAAEHPVYELGLRIPFGTALCEELIFRGALLGLFSRRHSVPVAIAMSSAVFGVWHVLPTLAARPDVRPADALPAIASAVATTAAAGCGLAWLRVRSGSIVAPVLVHAAVNVSAFAAARLVGRLDSAGRATLPASSVKEVR